MTDAGSADKALQLLIEGNARFRAGEVRFTAMRPDVLANLAKGQTPFATVLCCSDSRVMPELIFDTILGELFVIRVAGNVLSSEIAGNIQYVLIPPLCEPDSRRGFPSGRGHDSCVDAPSGNG